MSEDDWSMDETGEWTFGIREFGINDLLHALPRTILPSIFGRLSREDLKSWRLVNKYWYDNCSVAEIIKKEKLVFHYGLCGEDVARLGQQIIDCKRIRPTIEFHGFSLKRLPSAIWSHFGETLTSLFIHECFVDDEIVCQIILHSPNLVNLHLQVHSSYACRIFWSTQCLDQLLQKRVKRSKLRSLKLFTRYFPVPDEAFFKLFQIYPNIEVLGRDFLFIDKTLSDPVIEFFSRLTRLVKIELRILSILKRETREEQAQTFKTNVLKILSSVSRIKALRLESNCVLQFTKDEFSTFLRAIQNLESLDLNFHNFNFDSFQPNNCLLPSIEFKFLTDLRLTCPSSSIFHYDANLISLEILRRCSTSLRYLHITGAEIKYEVMECIIRDHTELKKLDVPGLKCHEDCTKRLHPRPIDQLRNLEFLSFNFPEKTCVVDILLRLDCSRLKGFQTKSFYSHDNLNDLLYVLTLVAPQLETLSLLSECCLSLNDYLPYLKKFHKLRCFILGKNYVTKDYLGDTFKARFKVLFDACPSLVYLICPSSRMVCYRSMGSLHMNPWYSDNICDNLSIFRSTDYAGL